MAQNYYSKSSQIARGLAQGLNNWTRLRQQQFDREDADIARQLANRMRYDQAAQRLEADEARQDKSAQRERSQQQLRAFTELSRAGDVNARNALAQMAGLEGVNTQAFDAQNMAMKLFEPALRQGQYGIAEELAQRLNLTARPEIPAKQRAEVDLLGARRLAAEADQQIKSQVANARIAHLTALTKAANQQTKKVIDEAKRLASGANAKGINDLRQVLVSSNSMLEQQFAALQDQPDFWQDENSGKINPAYQAPLDDLKKAFNYNTQVMKTLTDYAAKQALPREMIERSMSQAQLQAPAKAPARVFRTPDGLFWQRDTNGNYRRVR